MQHDKAINSQQPAATNDLLASSKQELSTKANEALAACMAAGRAATRVAAPESVSIMSTANVAATSLTTLAAAAANRSAAALDDSIDKTSANIDRACAEIAETLERTSESVGLVDLSIRDAVRTIISATGGAAPAANASLSRPTTLQTENDNAPQTPNAVCPPTPTNTPASALIGDSPSRITTHPA